MGVILKHACRESPQAVRVPGGEVKADGRYF